jgi:HSP20 family protein
MTRMKWDPVCDFRILERNLFQLLDRAAGSRRPAASWEPAVELLERGDEQVIRVELPGVSREQIEIGVEGKVLSVRGRREREADGRGERCLRSERNHGSFARHFKLPETVDAARIRATQQDGVLEIVLPRQERAKAKRIEVVAA